MALNIGRIYEMPLVYVIMGLLSIILMLDNFYNRAGQVILGLVVVGSILFFTRSLAKKRQIEVNAVKKNSLQSMVVAVVALAITVGIAIAIGSVAFGWGAGAIANFFAYNKASILGAPVSPFAGNPFIEFLIFVVMFPITETIIFIQLYDLMLLLFGVQKITYKDIRVWLATIPMIFGAILYHIYAKSVATGRPNENVLLVIGILFFMQLVTVIYTGSQNNGKAEMEPAIHLHIINNALALGIAGTIAVITNPWTLLFVAVIAVMYFSQDGRKLLRKWNLAT